MKILHLGTYVDLECSVPCYCVLTNNCELKTEGFSVFIHKLFEKIADQMKDNIALSMDGQFLNYNELENLSNKISHALIEEGVRPGEIVGVCLARSQEMVATILGILKSGAAYLPLDSEYPIDRIKYMVEHSRVKKIVAHEKFISIFSDLSSDVLIFEAIKLNQYSSSQPLVDESMVDLAYVIYTSGSTGKPKGVSLGHKALINLIEWQNDQTVLKINNVTLQFSPLSFDVHFQEIFSTLTLGGHLVLIKEEVRLDSHELLKTLVKNKVNRLFLPYVALNYLAEIALRHELFPDSIKEIITAGEQLKITPNMRLFFKENPSIILYNHYGPSETHVVTSFTLSGSADLWPNLPPIGKSISNANIYILDEKMSLVPKGSRGDIYIGGICLANGYLNSPELTSEKFFNTKEFGRIYKTGDIGIEDGDGNIIFLGRKDAQVKIRGYRIELGEIEIAIMKKINIERAVVKVIDDENESYICAYVLGSFDLSKLRESLRSELPDYMIPGHFLRIDSIPLTPSGKVDYKKLPLPDSSRPDLAVDFISPESPTELFIERCWKKYLRIQRIGVNDNFFDLGGTSLMAIKILIDINHFSEKKLTIVHLFQYATIGQIADFIDSDRDMVDSFLDLEQPGEGLSADSGDIAVIGMSGRFPGAVDIDQFWDNLVEIKNNIEIFDQEQVNPLIDSELANDSSYVFCQGSYPGQESFDYKFFGMTPREAELMDPQQRKFLELTYEGVEMAGYNPDTYKGTIGIFAGMGNSKYSQLVEQYPEKVKMIGDFNVMLGLEKDYIATRAAFKLNLKGPALSIHTACSTSLVAIVEAVKNLRTRSCDMALAGGIAISGSPHSGHLFQEGGILSQNGECRSFDNEATGTIFTDGGGVVVLKRLSDAEKDGDNILAVIKGVGINNDGSSKMSFTAPSVEGQADAIFKAQRDAQITADSIGFIEGHGTATPIGDPIEVEALTKAFRKSTDKKKYCYLSSLKSNMGHLTGAAGVASFIKTVKVVNTGIIPGTAHFKSVNRLIDIENSPFIITNKTESFPALQNPRRAGVSSFGVGGTNAHIIVEEYKSSEIETINQSNRTSLFKISAKSQEQLEIMQNNLVKFLKTSPVSNWNKIAYTLETGRKEYNFRSIIVADEQKDLERLTISNSNKGEFKRVPDVYFMFPGQGAHYKKMGSQLYLTNEIFRGFFDQCCEITSEYTPYNIKEIIFSENSEEDLNDTYYSQPSIFIIEYALAMTMKTIGISPKSYIGHSIGEFVAATLNGVFSLEDAIRAILKRAELMRDLPLGMMLSVNIAEEKLKDLLANKSLDIAAVNGRCSCVVSGSVDEVKKFKNELADKNIASIELKTSHAFHSRIMSPAVEKFKKFLSSLTIVKSNQPMFSTITANLEQDLFGTVDYWANQLVDTVNFSRAISKILVIPNILLLEVGTRNVLSNLAKKELSASSGKKAAIVTLLSNSADLETPSFFKALGDLWINGVKPIDSRVFFSPSDRKKVIAPVYIFEKNRLWLDPKNIIVKNDNKNNDTMFNRNQFMNKQLSSLQSILIDLFERSSGIEVGNFDKDTTFLEMGMDSLFLTQVALLLKKELKATITFRELMENYGSINLLSVYLLDKVEIKESVIQEELPSAIIGKSEISQKIESKEEQIPLRNKVQQPLIVQSSLESIINRQLDLMSQQVMLLSGSQGSSQLTPIQSGKCVEQVQVTRPMSTDSQVTQVNSLKKVKASNIKEAFGAQARISTENSSHLTTCQKEEIKKFFDQYTTKTKGSKIFTQENRKNHADPRVVTGFKPESKEITYPIVVKKSYLQTLWDVDDNKYIDMTCGFGSNFFGNGNEKIKKHILRQIEAGIELGPQHPLVSDVSNMINEMTGNERTAFCNTGSEAVLGAMRIARTVTGREKIVVFSGSYHGINDEVILRGSKSGKSYPAAPGINEESVSNMIVLDYGTAESLKIIKEMASEIAAVLVEPVQSRRCDFHPIEFLKEVRKITLESKTCLIFDEIITGFRIHPAGAQGHFNIRADLCTYGKILGGGMPIGVVSGKAEYMDALDGGQWEYGDDSTPTVGVTYFAGTFVRHPLALAGAKGALEILKEGGGELLEQLNKKAQKFADELNLFLLVENAPIEMNNFGSLMKPKWNSDIPNGDLLFAILRYNGVHVYDGFPWFINLAHTDQEIAEVLSAFKNAVKTMQSMGLFPKNDKVPEKEIILNSRVFDQKGAPMVGAKIGRDENGNPAWFVEDSEKKGEYFLLKGQFSMDSKKLSYGIKKKKVTYDPFKTGPFLKAVPTTEAQREIWASIVMDENATLCYNESLAIELDGDLKLDALKNAFQYLLIKHDSLRSIFSNDGKTFYIKELGSDNIRYLDYTDKQSWDIENLKKSEVELKYDLVNGPCYRATLVKKSLDKYLFLLSAHHIICDGWSFAILLEDLSEFYNSSLKCIVPNTSGGGFSDFATEEYLHGKNLEHKAYWIKEFEKPLRTNSFPVEHKRPTFRTFNSARYDVPISKDLTRSIKKIGADEGCSLYSTLMSAFNIFLFNLTKSQDIVVGMALASQPSLGRNDLVGHMVNLLPLRIDLNEDVPFKVFMKSVRSKMLDAIEHQFYSYGSLVKDLKNIERDPAQMPLMNVVFNIDQQGPEQGLKLAGIKGNYQTVPRNYENFEIFINAVSSGDKLAFECQYNTNLLTSSIIENWFSAFIDLIDQLVKNPTKSIKSFDLSCLKIPQTVSLEKERTNQVLVRYIEIEEKIKKIWAQVLLNDSLDIEDNFFAVGGHSLLAVEMATLLKLEFKSNFSIKDIFENPTILSLAHKIGQGANKEESDFPKIVASNFTSAHVSYNQMQVWYLEEMHPKTLMHNLPSSIRIKNKVDRLALEKTIHLIIERHSSLRTAIVVEDGIPLQKILDKNLPIFKNHLELVKTNENEVFELLNIEAQFSFDKTRPPLLKAKLYQLGPEDYIFFFMVHHAIWDGWSFDIFFEELNTIYSAYVKNETPSFTKSSEIAYVDYSIWLSNLVTEEKLNNQVAYWEEKLKGPLPILDLPLDHKRPLKNSHKGASYPFTLSEERSDALRNYARDNKTSLFNVLLTAFKITLARYSGMSDIIVGLPVRGRDRPELMQTIGYFVNTIALRDQIELSQSFEENLKNVSNNSLEAFDNQLIPFQIVLSKIDYPKDSTRTPVFQTFFSYQDVSNREANLNGAQYTQINIDKTSVHTDLDLWIKASDSKIEGAFEYRKDLFKEVSIKRFEENFFFLVDFLSKNINKPLNKLRQIPLIHENKIMNEWNDSWTKADEFVPFHKMFEENARITPDAIAIETTKGKMTFGELDRLANRCANALVEKGVGPGELVAISLTRDSGLIASVLGVLKTGAGYVPLDPGFPQDRLDYMIESSKPKVLITDDVLLLRFTPHVCEKIILSAVISEDRFDKIIPESKYKLADTIYVIYTSGSTGAPKGVELTHGSVTNFLLSMKEKISVGKNDKILAVTTLSFDIAVLELFLPLLTGGTIYLATSGEAMDGSMLKDILDSKGITVMQATPSTWRLLVASGWKGNDQLKILCGGEAFPIDLANMLIPICQEVWNMYGPTETTVWSSCKKLNLNDSFITIGRPIANTSMYILDSSHLMKPIGAKGELFIGGLGLARGYFGREDLTSERFVDDPYIPGGKMYATGDIARFTHNGEVECLGRNDGQVKIRGYRIELGEIESELQKITNISTSAVTTSEYRPGDVRICAYFSTVNGVHIEERSLREKLSKKLPAYMIPSHFIQMETIPHTLNGKIDKNALPKLQDKNGKKNMLEVLPDIIRSDEDLKEKLRLLWISVLGVNELKDSDNYFDIGGNSLQAVQLFSKISSVFKINIPLSSLFEAENFGIFAKNFEDKIQGSRSSLLLQEKQNNYNESVALAPQLFKSLVAIKSLGSKNPLFCFHGVGGNILNYVSLIPATRGERPLLALQSVGLDGVTPPLLSIQNMAKNYIREIRLVQPSGPYLLAGGSMGGMVAFEVALQLIKSGETIEKIIMFDTFGPNLNLKLGNVIKKGSFVRRIKDAFNIRIKFGTNKILSQIYRTLGIPVPLAILLVEIERKNYQAIWNYYPSESLSADLYLIRSDAKNSGWYSDPVMGWESVVNGEIKTYEISGTHEDFIESAELVNVLKKLI